MDGILVTNRQCGVFPHSAHVPGAGGPAAAGGAGGLIAGRELAPPPISGSFSSFLLQNEGWEMSSKVSPSSGTKLRISSSVLVDSGSRGGENKASDKPQKPCDMTSSLDGPEEVIPASFMMSSGLVTPDCG